MASAKEYGYYIEGNKIAIVERDTAFDNNVDSKEYGPGVVRSNFKSPQSSVTDGLEIKYAYSPKFISGSTGASIGTQYHKFLGWSRNHLGKLLLFTHSYGTDAVQDITNLFTVGESIVIKNSEKWNGIHKIASHSSGSTASMGILTLETLCTDDDIFPSSVTADMDITAATGGARGYMNGNVAIGSQHIQVWKNQKADASLNPVVANRTAPHYIFIENAAHAASNGFWEISLSDTAGRIQFEKHLTMDAYGTVSSATEAIATYSNDNLTFYNIIYEEMDVFGSDAADIIQPTEDESDIIDLPSYLQKALVYYVKARLAEDENNIDLKEYMMREYKKHIEIYESSLMKGPRMISSGHHAIR